MTLDWSAINTALILAGGAYLWRQSQKIDTIYQSLYGVDGRNGMLKRLELLESETGTVDKRIEQTRHLLRNEIQVGILRTREDIEARLDRERK